MDDINAQITIITNVAQLVEQLELTGATLEMIVTMGEFLNNTLMSLDITGPELDKLQETIGEVTYTCQLIQQRREDGKERIP